jgi:bis(5'-nucleosidyl)-tetraphosphatase
LILEIKACGVLCFRKAPELSFLLLKQPRRWDVPKGHCKRAEDERACALRETVEETGIAAEHIHLDDTFRFVTQNLVRPRYLKGGSANKTYVIFLGFVPDDTQIRISEHEAFQWFKWEPPHHIQRWLIDPLLQAVEQHFRDYPSV